MSIERKIVQKLFESKGLNEAEFSTGGSTYKAVFGRYYKDEEEITREDYFKAKERTLSHKDDRANLNTPPKKSPKDGNYELYQPEQFDDDIDEFEDMIEDYYRELKSTHPDDREEILNSLDDISKKLSSMEEYLSDDQYNKVEELQMKIYSADDVDYEKPEPDYDMMPGGHDDY